MQRRADVQNLSAILFQFRERCATDIECSLEIDIDDSAESVGRKAFSGAKKISGSAVNNDIYLSKSIDSRGDRFLDFFRFANIGGDSNGFTDDRGFGCGALPDGRASAPSA